MRGGRAGELGRCWCQGFGLGFELLELLAGFPGGEGGEVEYRDIVGLGDADPHGGAASQFAAAGPANDGVDGGVEVGAEEYGNVSGVELPCGVTAFVPCGMKLGGYVECRFLLVGGEGVGAWVTLVVVVAGPRQEDVASLGARALRECSVGAGGAAAVQVPSFAVEPLGNGFHVVEDGRGGLA